VEVVSEQVNEVAPVISKKPHDPSEYAESPRQLTKEQPKTSVVPA
jgi:hypothetical protein